MNPFTLQHLEPVVVTKPTLSFSDCLSNVNFATITNWGSLGVYIIQQYSSTYTSTPVEEQRHFVRLCKAYINKINTIGSIFIYHREVMASFVTPVRWLPYAFNGGDDRTRGRAGLRVSEMAASQ